MQTLETPFAIRRLNVLDLTTRLAQSGDRVAHQKLHARRLAELHQLACEAIGVARFVFSGVRRAGELRANVAQRGFEFHSFVRADDLPLAPQRAHLLCGRKRRVELFL